MQLVAERRQAVLGLDRDHPDVLGPELDRRLAGVGRDRTTTNHHHRAATGKCCGMLSYDTVRRKLIAFSDLRKVALGIGRMRPFIIPIEKKTAS